MKKLKSRPWSLWHYSGADPGEVKWVNFHPPFSEPPSFFLFSYPWNIDWFSYIITKIHPPFQNPRSTPFTSDTCTLDITNSCHACKELKEEWGQARLPWRHWEKVGLFNILNSILAKTRNLIPKKGFLVVSWIRERISRKTSPHFSREVRLSLISREKWGQVDMLLSPRRLWLLQISK